jgi:threonine dehydrogenase-like Zn-dependent dehydrogenase
MIRELVVTAPGQVAFREVERRPLRAGEIRVRSCYGAAKHGTEMAIYKGYVRARGRYDPELRIFNPEKRVKRYPLPLGNMCVGEVIEVAPDVEIVALGDVVFRNGSFKEEHIWQAAKVCKLPEGVPWQAAVCLDPADFAVGAIRDGNVRLGDAVAVFGMGAIGLIVVQLAKLAGAYPVIAIEPIPLRRNAAAACGADLVLDPSQCDAGLEIKRATEGRGADVCIEYSGHHLALQAALRGVAYGGTVVAGAFPGPYPAGLDFGAEAHMNRPKIVFSRACSEPNPDYPNWDEQRIFAVAWRLLASGAIQTKSLIEPVVPFDRLCEEYPKIATHPQENIKLGVQF